MQGLYPELSTQIMVRANTNSKEAVCSITYRQNRLLLAEDWKRVYLNLRNADFPRVTTLTIYVEQ